MLNVRTGNLFLLILCLMAKKFAEGQRKGSGPNGNTLVRTELGLKLRETIEKALTTSILGSTLTDHLGFKRES